MRNVEGETPQTFQLLFLQSFPVLKQLSSYEVFSGTHSWRLLEQGWFNKGWNFIGTKRHSLHIFYTFQLSQSQQWAGDLHLTETVLLVEIK